MDLARAARLRGADASTSGVAESLDGAGGGSPGGPGGAGETAAAADRVTGEAAEPAAKEAAARDLPPAAPAWTPERVGGLEKMVGTAMFARRIWAAAAGGLAEAGPGPDLREGSRAALAGEAGFAGRAGSPAAAARAGRAKIGKARAGESPAAAARAGRG